MNTYDAQKSIAQALVANGFKKFYLMAEQVLQDGKTTPAIPRGDDWVYCGIVDNIGAFGYFREIGFATMKPMDTDGCSKLDYNYVQQVRLVIFSPREKRSHDGLLNLVLNSLTAYQILTFNQTKAFILSQEQGGTTPQFGASDLYCSVDFLVSRTTRLATCPDGGTEIECFEPLLEICEA